MDRKSFWFPPESDAIDLPFVRMHDAATELDKAIKAFMKFAEGIRKFPAVSGNEDDKDQLLELTTAYIREIRPLMVDVGKLAAHREKFEKLIQAAFHSAHTPAVPPSIHHNEHGAWGPQPAFAHAASGSYSYDRR